MGKYSNTFTQKELPKKNQTHEIWKSFGCLLMMIIPIISIAAGYETVNLAVENGWKFIPHQMMGLPRMPDFFYRSSGLVTIFSPVAKIENLYAIALMSLIYIFVLSGLISMVYAAVYTMVGPSRYTPLDAPPQKIKVTKKSR